MGEFFLLADPGLSPKMNRLSLRTRHQNLTERVFLSEFGTRFQRNERGLYT